MTGAIPQFTPVNLITGFLGSGKTTLLQRLLHDPALADTAVLINEFGEVGLDHHLLERIDERMVLLQSGCLCCTIRGELSESIRDLHSRRTRGTVPPFRRLVIESTGLADPFPVLTTIHADPVLKHHFRLGNVIATVDAVNGLDQLACQPESVKQVAVADHLVITKTDIARADATEALLAQVRAINPAAPLVLAADTVAALLAHVRAINPAAPLVLAAESALDANVLLARDAFDLDAKSVAAQGWFAAELAHPPHAEHGHDPNRHGSDIRAFALVFDRPLDWTVFGIWLTMLLNRHGTEVLRVKGILDVDGVSAPVAIHGVQHLVHPPVHLRGWPDEQRQSRIVFIVKGLDPAAIRRSLAAFTGLVAVAA